MIVYFTFFRSHSLSAIDVSAYNAHWELVHLLVSITLLLLFK